jgi:hypothetical protein
MQRLLLHRFFNGNMGLCVYSDSHTTNKAGVKAILTVHIDLKHLYRYTYTDLSI